MAFGISTELLVILFAILLLFGAAAIPKLARSLGRAQGEFLKSKREFDSEMKRGQQEAGSPVDAPGASEEERRVRAAARDLGIDEEGKGLDEVKRLLNERLS